MNSSKHANRFFIVNQKNTYKEEKQGGFIWSPQANKSGGKNIGYECMKYVKKGDVIFHNLHSKIVAVSESTSDCYESDNPSQGTSSERHLRWNQNGYKVNLTYHELDNPLDLRDAKEWMIKNHSNDKLFPFDVNGKVKQKYLGMLPIKHAEYLLDKINEENQNLSITRDRQISEDESSNEDRPGEMDDYTASDLYEIFNDLDSKKPERWKFSHESQKLTSEKDSTGKLKAARIKERAKQALYDADFKCEINEHHETFISRSSKPYMEPHHLIPLSRFSDFNNSLDVPPNIVSLCSNCHNKLHYGLYEEVEPLLVELFHKREDQLNQCGLVITLDQLLNYYKQ